ncbi:hypothetical protein KAX17_05250, partial [Candidatus Bipolaricaulota bacterium]|nr:hypothetical protein [Candidatus Bipolaricaulota bacterium]
IEEVSWRLVLNHRIRLHYGSSFDFVGGAATFIPSRVGFLRSWGVVLCTACQMDLLEQLHGCRMARESERVNM